MTAVEAFCDELNISLFLDIYEVSRGENTLYEVRDKGSNLIAICPRQEYAVLVASASRILDVGLYMHKGNAELLDYIGEELQEVRKSIKGAN